MKRTIITIILVLGMSTASMAARYTFTGFVAAGTYDAGTTYAFGDIVASGGSTYLCFKDTCPAATAISNTAYYMPWNVKGDKGDTGDAGANGADGSTGPAGTVTNTTGITVTQGTSGQSIEMLEGSGGGTNKVTISAPSTLAADVAVNAAYLGKGTKCTTINAATTASDFPVERFPMAVTITGIHVYQSGATNVVGGFDECTGTGGICTSVTAVDADITGTADAWVNDDGSLTNPAIAAGNGIFWHTTSVSGTNTYTMACFDYTVD